MNIIVVVSSQPDICILDDRREKETVPVSILLIAGCGIKGGAVWIITDQNRQQTLTLSLLI